MAFGDEFSPDKILGYPLREFAEDNCLPPKLVSERIKLLCKKICNVLAHDLIDVSMLNDNEKDFIKKLTILFTKRVDNLSISAQEMLKVSI